MLVASPINPVPGFYEHIRAYRAALKTGARPQHPGDVAALFLLGRSTQPRRRARRGRAEPASLISGRIGEQAMLGGRGQYVGSYAYLEQVRERAWRR